MILLVKSSAAAIALTAASLVKCSVTGSSTNLASASSDVHSYGVNKCKGFNDRKTATNACKENGSCKGMGFVAMSSESCDKVGGRVNK
jgi:hypothetical protein